MQSASEAPYRLGLTGSIGMGKTTIGGMFRDLKVPVLDADAAVHDLYAAGGAAVPVVQELFPSAVVNGARARARARCLHRARRSGDVALRRTSAALPLTPFCKIVGTI